MAINVDFVGRLGSDAEVFTGGSEPFIAVSVGVNEVIKHENVTTWMRLSLEMKDYEKLLPYLTKGKLVHVHGRETCNLYTNSSGTTVIRRRVNVSRLDFINVGMRNGNEGNSNLTIPASLPVIDANIELPESESETNFPF